ncbi:MAG: HEAT repeat domain-containing protein, partial [Leptospiraceae bacterium]|nr:HEAT repeat domain-containing protein [Leptospiraceae bacterium]
GYHSLLEEVSKILHSKTIDTETLARILDLYDSYGNELGLYLPNYLSDYEYILRHAQEDWIVVSILKNLSLKQDRRFMYSAIELMTHRSSEVRKAVFQYLNSFKDDRILPYIFELGNSEKPIERYYYLEALNYIDDERMNIHVAKLLNDPSPAIRSEAIHVVNKFKMKNLENQVLNLVKADPNYEVRKYAIQYAESQNLKHRLDIFTRGLSDTNYEVREVSILSVKIFRMPVYAPYISKALETETLSNLRMEMIESLIQMNHHGGGQGLVATLSQEPNPNVRRKAAYAIGLLGAKIGVPSLNKSLLRDISLEVRLESAKSLGRMKEKAGIPALLTKLRDFQENEILRSQILLSLEQIDDPKVMPYVFDIMEEETTAFRSHIKDFMRNMLYKYHNPKKEYLVSM